MMKVERESSTASPSELKIPNDDISTLKDYLSRCPSIEADSEALQIVFAVLKQIEDKGRTKHKLVTKSDESLSHDEPIKTKSACSVNLRNADEIDLNHSPPMKLLERAVFLVGSVVRFALVEFPLIALFALLVFFISVQCVQKEYLSPQLKLMEFFNGRDDKENTYYHRECDAADISTTHVEDLLIKENFSPEDCLDHMMVHGMSLYPDILTRDTASNLRDYILERIENLNPSEEISVIANENRWSFGIGANEDPIITKALNEIATNNVLRGALEKIAGRNPAVVEFTTITVGYGAGDQYWHHDVISEGSSLKYSKSFIPTYNLFIPLQDTTEWMGATEVCPGTHVCAEYPPICDELAFPVSGKGGRVWQTGHAVLMNQQSFHRGIGHKDPDAPTRALFILTFAPRWTEVETRIIGHGGSYSMRWDMWGHTLNDMINASINMAQPWALLRSMGLYNRNSDWGWDFISQVSMRIANADTDFTTDDLENHINDGGFGLPSLLTPSSISTSTWDKYLVDHLRLWVGLAIAANIIALVSYFMGTICVGRLVNVVKSKVFKKKVSFDDVLWGTCKNFFRLVIIDFILVIFAMYALRHISGTPWAKDIKTGRLYSPSFDTVRLDDTLRDRLTTLVTTSDKLISQHYDSKSLYSLRKFLDYHPGNMAFDKKVRHAAPLFLLLNNNDKMRLVHFLVKEILESRRVLMQDQSGDWNVLTTTEIESQTARALSLYQNPLVTSLEEERISMDSFYLNKYLRSTVMGGRLSSLLLDNLLGRIFEAHAPFMFEPFDLKAKKTKKVIAEAKQKHEKNSYFLPFPIPSRHAVHQNQNLQSMISRNPRYPKFKTVHSRAESMLMERMVVEAKPMDSDRWYPAKIWKIRCGSYFDVSYLQGGFDFGLAKESIVQFKQYTIGETIEARKRGQDDSWQKARVVRIVTKNTVEVKYADGNVDKLAHLFLRRFDHRFMLGDDVACRGRRQGWFRARIIKYNKDGTLNVLFEKGSMKYNVHEADLLDWSWFQNHP